MLVCHCARSVASLLAFGACIALVAPSIRTPGLFAAAFHAGIPVAFAVPGIVLRRLGVRTER